MNCYCGEEAFYMTDIMVMCEGEGKEVPTTEYFCIDCHIKHENGKEKKKKQAEQIAKIADMLDDLTSTEGYGGDRMGLCVAIAEAIIKGIE